MALTAPQEATAQATFGPFATDYDDYTEHPLYGRWVLGLEALARAHGLRGGRVLDAGCGTGKSFLPLLDLGYEVTGCDAVPEMLARADRKAAGRATLVEADLVDLPVLGRFDLALCLNDVVNYLLSDAALHAALSGLARNLRPGGLLVFDANTPAAFRTVFATAHRRTAGDKVFFWDPSVTETGGDVRADVLLEVFARRDDGSFERAVSRHVQRYHPPGAVRDALDAAGLSLQGVYGQHNDGRRDDRLADDHFKAIYVARRDPPDVAKEVNST